MEDAVKALEMSFAVMVFVIALSVAIISFNKAKAVSDAVLYSKDETNYYEYTGVKGKAAENRIVGLESIIPTLYKYYKENYTVVFREAQYDIEKGEFIGNKEPFKLYQTKSRYSTDVGYILWGKKVEGKPYATYDLNMYRKYNNYKDENNVSNAIFSNIYDSIGSKKGNTDIFSFDLEEETIRHEPWTGSYDKTKQNLDCFLKGDIYYNPNNGEKYIDYSEQVGEGGFIRKIWKRKICRDNSRIPIFK